MKNPTNAYLAVMGGMPEHIPHWEHISNPELLQYVTGIDPYMQPRKAHQEFLKKYYIDLGFNIPVDDKPVINKDFDGGITLDDKGRKAARWGMSSTEHWEWGKTFETVEQAIGFEPLKHLDMRNMEVVVKYDYSLDDEEFYKLFAEKYNNMDYDLDRDIVFESFYNTMFMWPLLTFGWEIFLEMVGCYKKELKRIMEDFAVINRKVFKTFSKLPINMVVCHDDICMSSGPVCSPAWLRENIYPYYEEFFDIIHSGGKKVIFMCDGNIDKIADDVIACGADGLISEPFTNWKRLSVKYPEKVLAGEGDNRILTSGTKDDIRSMVESMVETASNCSGYFMCIGNHIPWNVPPENIVYYLELARELGARR